MAKEVGVRKVLGATKISLGKQFMVEVLLLTSIAFACAILLVEIALPFMPMLFGKPIEVLQLFRFATAGGLLLLLLLVGLGTGIYPSVYLASFDTIQTLKGLHNKRGKQGFRNGLLVFQFVISTVLIISTLLITQQLKFTRTKALGFNTENVLVIPLVGESVQSKAHALKQELIKSPRILGTSACSEPPGRDFTQNGYQPEGRDEFMLIHVVDIDDDYFQLFDLQLTAGRVLSRNRPSDRTAYLINETLAKQLDWKHPIGKKITRNGEHEVVGVVKDFHYASLHQPIKPLIITCSPYEDRFDFLAVKLSSGDPGQAIRATQQAWKRVYPETPLDFSFLDDNINQIYEAERRLQNGFFLVFRAFYFYRINGHIWINYFFG